jgi:hypothetical protein
VSKPFFTVVMPLYNHAAYVGAAIESALAQSFGDFELVICNDGSTDDSLDVVNGFRDERLRVINKPNGGTVTALNACLLKSEGSHICWLSSDDLFAPEKLAAHHAFHVEHPDAPISVGPFGYLRDGKYIPDKQLRVSEAMRLLQFAHGNYINGLSVCAHRRMYGLYGQFDNRYRFAHDVERWFRFFRYELPQFLSGAPLSWSRLDSSITANADLLGQLDVLKFLCNDLHAHGLRALLPAETAAQPLTLETLVRLCGHVLKSDTLFVRFDLREHMLEAVATFLHKEKQVQQLPAMMAHFQQMGNTNDAAWVLRELDAVASLIHHGEPRVSLSFAEQVARLKGKVTSPAQRDVLERYLRVGF